MEEESKVRNDQTGTIEESHSFANKLIKNDKSDIQSDHQVSRSFLSELLTPISVLSLEERLGLKATEARRFPRSKAIWVIPDRFTER